MPKDSPAIYLLREEEAIEPLHFVFAHMLRRSFSEMSLTQTMAYAAITEDVRVAMKSKRVLEVMYQREFTVSVKLYFLRELFRPLYDEVVRFYRSIFPSIERCELTDMRTIGASAAYPERVPVFAIKEKFVDRLISIHELSSGMQKVLLIITDMVSLPEGSTYVIDEYENSLGVNAINFLPTFLADHGAGKQFIISTHHPYLINNIPVKFWRVFHRRGSEVLIKNGSYYEDKFSKSKQQAFIQLINDQFYADGTT